MCRDQDRGWCGGVQQEGTEELRRHGQAHGLHVEDCGCGGGRREANGTDEEKGAFNGRGEQEKSTDKEVAFNRRGGQEEERGQGGGKENK